MTLKKWRRAQHIQVAGLLMHKINTLGGGGDSTYKHGSKYWYVLLSTGTSWKTTGKIAKNDDPNSRYRINPRLHAAYLSHCIHASGVLAS